MDRRRAILSFEWFDDKRIIQACIALIALGIVLRMLCTALCMVGWDGTHYIAMGDSFLRTGFRFEQPWGDWEHHALENVPSHHFSPLFPIYLSLWFSVFGCSVGVAKIASFVLTVLALLVVYFCTADLFGRRNGLMVTAVVSLDPTVIWCGGNVLAENMILLFFTFTMWAILRGTKDDRFMVLAGLFAGLTYLSKASLGYFFIIAGLGGLGWRFYFMRWDVFRNKWYLLGIILFGLLLGSWSLRNIMIFEFPNWETSGYVGWAIGEAIGKGLGNFILESAVMLVFFMTILLVYALYWHRELSASLHRIRDEKVSCLWMSVFLIPLTSVFIVTAFGMVEDMPPYNYDRLRYLFLMNIPLLWLMVNQIGRGKDKGKTTTADESVTVTNHHERRMGPRDLLEMFGLRKDRKWVRSSLYVLVAGTLSLVVILGLRSGAVLTVFMLGGICCAFVLPWKGRFTLLMIVALIVSVNTATEAGVPAETSAANWFQGHLKNGDIVAFDKTVIDNIYHFYPIFYNHGKSRDNMTVISYTPNCTARFVVTAKENPVFGENYTRVASFGADMSSGGVITDNFGQILLHMGFDVRIGKKNPPTIFVWERIAP